ncbi:MAG TPA: hypothetical protein DCQ31_15040, partial [Bacteroidales bacterium]|nr:hypothetical protein [Bacteroidales bacterium]
FDTGFPAYVNNLGFSPDGKRLLASAYQLKEYKEFSLSGELLQTIAGYHEWCYGIGYLPNGNIYTMSSDGTAAIWDSQGKQLKKEKVIADWGGSSSALSGNGKVLAAAKASIEPGQQFINFIDAETLKAKKIGYLKNERVTTLALNSTGSLAASAVFENNKISLWTENGLLRQIEAKTNAFWGTALCFSPDDQYIAAGYYDYTVSLFKTDG